MKRPAVAAAPMPARATAGLRSDTGPDAAGVQDARQAIVAYLALYPKAADNAEGIAQWWLPTQRTLQPLPHVQAALQLLLQQGVVVARALPDGRLVYALAAGSLGGSQRPE